MKKIIGIASAVLLSTQIVFAGASKSPEEPMNVVFILADDLGWADTSLYGHTSLYQTPNIERLAARGMTFNRAYSASPLCSPTRASILTGRNPARTGLTAPECHLPHVLLKPRVGQSAEPGRKDTQVTSVSRLDTALPTLGKLLQEDGYATGHFGKWHLGPEPYSPLEHGFDVDIPHYAGPGPAGSFVAPWQYPDFKANYPKEHIEDRMAEEAIAWMKSVNGKPYFMNYWQFSVHAPFDAKQELIDLYKTKIDANDPQRSPTYAAMVHSLDDAVGSLLAAIDESGMADRTAIVFYSDNGGNMYDSIDGTTPTSNFPLRGGKASMFEGGVRVPAIIVWPGVTKAGTRSDEIIQSTDLYPTFLKMMDVALPQDYAIDGVDLTPVLKGGELNRDAIFTYFPHSPPIVPDWLPSSMSVHSGDWKLIRLFYQGDNGAHDYLLYNLAKDESEQNNVAAQYPEKVATLDAMIESFIQDADVTIPNINPNFDPAHYNPSIIGIPQHPKPITNKDERANANPDRPDVDGWQAGGTCSISQGDGVLVIKGSGGDPFISLKQDGVNQGGPFTVSFRMKSAESMGGNVFYNQPASPANSILFPIKEGGDWGEVSVVIEEMEINGLRIDPSEFGGQIEIDWIELKNAAGETLNKWDF